MSKDVMKIQENIINEFAQLSQWFDRYQHLISLGRALQPLKNDEKNDDTALLGCQAHVWIKTTHQEDTLHFSIDSDSLITKGILSLLLRIYNDQTPKDILETHLYFPEKIGLYDHLSPMRANGLQAMIQRIESEARDSLSLHNVENSNISEK